MHVTKKQESPTHIDLIIKASQSDLDAIKQHTLSHFAQKIKLPGFRAGKAPLSVVEKHVDQNQLQAEFVEEAINHLYQKALQEAKLRPIDNPNVQLQKFVPYTELEFKAEVTILGPVTLPDYTKIKKTKPTVKILAQDVQGVIESLGERAAKREEVKRPAKSGDEVVIDFKGEDAKKQPINGAEAEDYPLVLGSNSFIPGFEDNVVGMKTGDDKTFTLTFPKDYGVKTLANKKVTFTVKVKKVHAITKPVIDDAFASTVGPFKTLEDLKADIKKQLHHEKQKQADSQLQNELVSEIVNQSNVSLPVQLVDEQTERLKTEVRQNLTYRGQTWQEMLEAEGTTEDAFVAKELRPEAERRVKTGLVLAEIASKEGVDVTPEEIDQQLQLLKAQYQDAAMQAELDKPSARQEIASRLVTEKTVRMLIDNATAKK